MILSKHHLYCLDDPHSWQIKGTSGSLSAAVFYIQVDPCTNRTDCNTDPIQLQQFIESHSFLYMYNTAEYQTSEYGANAVKKTIVGPKTIPLENKAYAHKLQKNHLVSEENLLGFSFVNDESVWDFFTFSETSIV